MVASDEFVADAGKAFRDLSASCQDAADPDGGADPPARRSRLRGCEFGAPPDADPLELRCLKPKEVAALTGLDEAYVHALCRRGTMPVFRAGWPG
jgi:hypothetical protein